MTGDANLYKCPERSEGRLVSFCTRAPAWWAQAPAMAASLGRCDRYSEINCMWGGHLQFALYSQHIGQGRELIPIPGRMDE